MHDTESNIAHVRARAARSHVMHVMYSEAGLEDGVHVHVRGAFVASVSSAYSHGRHHSESSHVQKWRAPRFHITSAELW